MTSAGLAIVIGLKDEKTRSRKWNAAQPFDNNDASDDSNVDRSDEVQSTFGKMLTESGISLDDLFPAEGALSVEPRSTEVDSRLHSLAIDVDSSAVVPSQVAYPPSNLEPVNEIITERQPTYLRKVLNWELFGTTEPERNTKLDAELAGNSQAVEFGEQRNEHVPSNAVEKRLRAATGAEESGITKAMDYLKSLPRELVISLSLLFGCLGQTCEHALNTSNTNNVSLRFG